MTCIAVRYDEVLRTHGLLKGSELTRIWTVLSERIAELDSNQSMFRLNHFQRKALHFCLMGKQKPKESKKRFEAWEHHVLMMVM
jgi:hypothetical protein